MKRSSLLLILQVAVICLTQAQNPKSTSRFREDSALVKTLIGKANTTTREGNFSAALELAIQARNLAESIHESDGIASALLASAFTYEMMGAFDAGLKDLKEAEIIYANAKDKVGLGKVNQLTAGIFDDISHYNVAFDYHEKALRYAVEANHAESISKALNGLGINSYRRGSPTTALFYHLKALHVSDSIGNIQQQAAALNNLAVIYEELKDYNKSMTYYVRSLKLMQNANLKPYIAKSYSNIGGVHIALGNYDEAKENLDSALTIREKIGDKRQAYTLSNYGDLHRKLKNYDAAEKYYRESFLNAKEINNQEAELHPLKGMTDLYFETNRLDDANKQLEVALDLARKLNTLLWVRELYLSKAKLDSARGDFKGAIVWFKKYHTLTDSLFEENRNEKVAFPEYVFKGLDKIERSANTFTNSLVASSQEEVNVWLIRLIILLAVSSGILLVALSRVRMATQPKKPSD